MLHDMRASHSVPQHIHLIGIGGTGLSAIARFLMERGYVVTGSDRALSPAAEELAAEGARITAGHSPENVLGADLVVRSSAVPDDNVEVQAAIAQNVPVLKRSQFLGKLMEGSFGIGVAGTHGKTTITAMIAWLLASLGEDPSYIIGSTSKNLGKNAHAGRGKAFVIEADEYDRMFLGLNPDVMIVSYLEHDHPDCFPTPEIYFQAFVDFANRLRPGGYLLAAQDSSEAHRLADFIPAGTRALTFGTDPAANYCAANIRPNTRGGFDYEAIFRPQSGESTRLARISLQVPGEHNVRNSLAALAVIHQSFNSSPERIRQAAAALGAFTGTGRRFDLRGEVNGIAIIDDYAHHPTELRASLAAARARYPNRRIWALWQPHTYSRTRSLMTQFTGAFTDADRVVVTEVYAAREKAQDFDNFSAAQVVQAMNHPGAAFVPSLEAAGELLLQQLQPGDVLIVLSAGDAITVGERLLPALKERMIR